MRILKKLIGLVVLGVILVHFCIVGFIVNLTAAFVIRDTDKWSQFCSKSVDTMMIYSPILEWCGYKQEA